MILRMQNDFENAAPWYYTVYASSEYIINNDVYIYQLVTDLANVKA